MNFNKTELFLIKDILHDYRLEYKYDLKKKDFDELTKLEFKILSILEAEILEK